MLAKSMIEPRSAAERIYWSYWREMQRAITQNLGLWAWHNISPLFRSRKPPVPFETMSVGQEFSKAFETNERDTYYFGYCTHDWNEVHFDPQGVAPFEGPICHGMHLASYISCVLGTEFPGQGTIFSRMNNMAWLEPVRIGEKVTVTLYVFKLEPKKKPDGFNRITFKAVITREDGKTAVEAEPVAYVR